MRDAAKLTGFVLQDGRARIAVSRVLSADSPTRPRRQKHLSRACACAAGGAAPSAATRSGGDVARPHDKTSPLNCLKWSFSESQTGAGGRERGAPLRAAGPSHVTSVFRPEHEVGLFADGPRGVRRFAVVRLSRVIAPSWR